jgi:hypothetical protein
MDIPGTCNKPGCSRTVGRHRGNSEYCSRLCDWLGHEHTELLSRLEKAETLYKDEALTESILAEFAIIEQIEDMADALVEWRQNSVTLKKVSQRRGRRARLREARQ